jgi:molecular chaperone GrpE
MTKSPETGSGEVPESAGSGDGAALRGAGEIAPEPELDVAIEVEVDPPSAEQRIAELEGRAKDSHDRHLRAVAELDNVRKRNRKELEDGKLDAQGRVLREMLPIMDNLERALAAAAQPKADDGTASIVEGVRLVVRQFTQALERFAVHPIEARGKAFDPTEHEAVSQVESSDAAPGTVVDVLQTGYRIGERLLRPALVVVAKAPAARAPAGNGSEPTGPNGHDPDAD